MCGTSSAERAVAMEQELRAGARRDRGTPRRIAIAIDPYATFGPVAFDPALGALLRDKAEAANSPRAT